MRSSMCVLALGPYNYTLSFFAAFCPFFYFFLSFYLSFLSSIREVE